MKPRKNWVDNKVSPPKKNPLKYVNRLGGRLIWSIIEMVNFFVQMKIGKFVDVKQNNLEITLKIMKKYLENY